MQAIDFDLLSDRLSEFLLAMHPEATAAIRESMRHVWNIRGECDSQAVETLAALMGRRKAQDYLAHLQREMGKFDR